jgi:hypothetical protein
MKGAIEMDLVLYVGGSIAVMIGMVILEAYVTAQVDRKEQEQESQNYIGRCPICHSKAYLIPVEDVWTVKCDDRCPHNCWTADESPEQVVYDWRMWAGDQWHNGGGQQ